MINQFQNIINRLFIFISAIFLLTDATANADTLKGKVIDAQNATVLPYTSVVIIDSHSVRHSALSDADGNFSLTNLPQGKATVIISYIGYDKLTRTVNINNTTTTTFRLSPDANLLNEVVVTAKTSQSITTSSVIDRAAIEHLQPSSFSDLLSLLPGGSSSLPNLTNANTIRLRQAGSGNSNYDISALGTSFITDDIPINTNANMQLVRQASSASSGDPDAGRNFVGQGVDMRAISTDNIESVEVITGIAPVEYGDLTSGVVIIKRKLTATPFEARFKADSYSKLLYIGKGIEAGNFVANFGLDYLDAKADPRNSLNNYKRLTLSSRLQNTWNINDWQLRWRGNVDYTGSFDNEKHDPEILKQADDRYRSDYNRFSISQSLLLRPKDVSSTVPGLTLSNVNFDIAVAYEQSRIDQDKAISISRDMAVSTTLEEGEHDGIYLPYHYLANVVVDGKPLNFYSKLKGLFQWNIGKSRQSINIGAEWKIDKNFGKGQQYDPAHPIYPGTPYRPRIYSHIPAEQQLSAYIQDNFSTPIRDNRLSIAAGLRSSQLLNLDARYTIHNRPYIDPRVNIQWKFPSINAGDKPLVISLNGGWGRHTKFPTLLQLYPDIIYNDLVELNYFNLNPDYRRLYILTYVINPTNYDLRPARNDKWETRLGAEWNGYNFSATYFHEAMNNGFRSSGIARPFTYRDFDEKSIDDSSLSAPPAIDDISYEEKSILGLYGKTTNGSRLVKEGIEFQMSTRRFNAIKTRLTVNGAWFKTTYANSEPMFMTNTSQVINGVPVNDLYIGYYDNSTATVRQQFNTNFMTDTYLPRLGLAFSLTAECTWFTSSQSKVENGIPIAYMATDGNVYPYTDESRQDNYLQWLERKYSSSAWLKQTVPFWMYVNLKVTKDFGKKMRLALFIDRMIDYMPDYKTISGLTVRRTAKPYFGMELNLKI